MVKECIVPARPTLELTDSATWSDDDTRALDVFLGKLARWQDTVLACPGLTELDPSGSNVARSLAWFSELAWQEIRYEDRDVEAQRAPRR